MQSVGARYAPPLVLLAVAAGFTLMAQSFGEASRTMPQLIGAATALFCALDAVSRSGTAAGRSVARWLNPAASAVPTAPRHRQALAIGGLALLVGGMVLLGLLPAVFGFGLLALRLRGGRSWLEAALAGAGMALAVWLLFGSLLGLRLFPGLLFGGAW